MEIFGSTQDSGNENGSGSQFGKTERSMEEIQGISSEFTGIQTEKELEEFKTKWSITNEELGALKIAVSVAEIMGAWKLADDVENPTAKEAKKVEQLILSMFENMEGQEIAAVIVVVSLYAFKWALSQRG